MSIFFFFSRSQSYSHLLLLTTLHMVQAWGNQSAMMTSWMQQYKPMLMALSRAFLKDLTLSWENEDKCCQVGRHTVYFQPTINFYTVRVTCKITTNMLQYFTVQLAICTVEDWFGGSLHSKSHFTNTCTLILLLFLS